MKKLGKLIITTLMISTFLLMGCTSTASIDEVKKPEELPKEQLPVVTITIKDFGVIEAELYPHIAPNTVNNFIELANAEFYDGLIFHRIIKDFMIQGGDPQGTGMGGPGYSIKGEFTSNKFPNDLKHEEGVLSMARSKNPDSAGSQFFIMTKEASHLDDSYASFGKVTSGLDILHKIENVETDTSDRPIEPVVIESINVDTKGIEYEEAEKIK